MEKDVRFRKRPVVIDAITAAEVLDAASAGGFSAKSRTVPEWIVAAFEGMVYALKRFGGAVATVIPLTYDRARLVLSRTDPGFYDDGW